MIKYKKIQIAIIGLLISSFGVSQTEDHTIIDSIPFILTEHNNISIQAVMNEVDTLQLMLHTAANAITIISESAKNLKSINIDGVDTIKSWGGDSSARYSTKNTIQIGKITVEDQTIWENERSGPETDGKFGLDIFNGYIVEIDFDKKLLVIYKNLNESKVLESGYKKHELTGEEGFWFISGTSLFDNQEITSNFLIHTGFGGSLLFDDQTTEKYQLSEHLEIIKESELKDSYGNVLKTKKAILPEFLIAEQKLANVPIGFFEGAIGRQKISVLGGDILKRFNVLFDIPNTNIYLKPNSLMATPFFDI